MQLKSVRNWVMWRYNINAEMSQYVFLWYCKYHDTFYKITWRFSVFLFVCLSNLSNHVCIKLNIFKHFIRILSFLFFNCVLFWSIFCKTVVLEYSTTVHGHHQRKQNCPVLCEWAGHTISLPLLSITETLDNHRRVSAHICGRVWTELSF